MILPDPRRRVLYHFAFFQIGAVPSMKRPSRIVVQSSTDGGRSWSAPHTIGQALTVAEDAKEPYTGTQIRTGFVVPGYAVDPSSGALYVAWQDARFSSRRYDQIVVSRSLDQGKTWSRPARVSSAGRQAFVPNVAVAQNHVVGITYFETEPGRSSKPVTTSFEFAASRDRARSFAHRLVGEAFDLTRAPLMSAVPRKRCRLACSWATTWV